ncbi:hypothetical protein ACVITL_005816 [Rhizobium pisi]
MRKELLGFSILLVLSGAAVAAGTMTGKELTALLGEGKVITLGGPKEGYSGELMLAKDGTGHGEAKTSDGKVIKIDGTWHIKGNKFCRTWEELNDGKEVCETWNKAGDKAVRVMVGKKDIGLNSWN